VRRALAAAALVLAVACGRLTAEHQASSPAPEPPAPSGTPGASLAGQGWVSPDRRLPGGPITCPTGELVPLAADDPRVAEAAQAFLEAAIAHEEPDPRTMWELMDPSFRALFPSYDDFRAQVEGARYNPDYAVWKVAGYADAGTPTPEGEPGLPGLLFPWLMSNCSSEIIDSLRSGTWAEVDLWWPRLFDEGLSIGATQLFFLGRADGPKLWVVYH
jgi:hypothetical protein